MITIQSGMLIALGFLTAMLIGLLAAPAFWSRAVRLTTRRLKQTMPLTEMEIVADRDRIRAEYAIKMHKLETLVEQVKLAGARQQIEINRRDARVNMLEADLERLKAGYEEAQNARRVLEQTIADRLPRVESRLTDAKKLIFAREREIGELTRTADRQARALAEASSINAQQQGEIEQLSTTLSRAGRARHSNAEGDNALRVELDALRAKTREQAQLLARMQSLAGRPSVPGVAVAGSPGAVAAETGRQAAGADAARMADLDQELRQLRARNDDQSAEIARLKAGIAVFENDAVIDGKLSLRDNRVALKARAQSLEAQSAQQSETVAKLRAELAAANERLARQAAHYTGELRRLGTSAATGSGRARRAAERASLAERVVHAPGSSAASPPGGDNAAVAAMPLDKASDAAAAPHANGGAGGQTRPAAARDDGKPGVKNGEDHPTVEGGEGVAAATSPQGRPRLIDRIASLSRTS